jgi:hypothetical protein
MMTKADIDAMFAAAGIDPDAIESHEQAKADFREHEWAVKQAAKYSDDPFIWVCSRCGQELTVGKFNPFSDEMDEDDREDYISANGGKVEDRYETIAEATKRCGVNPNCADAMMQDVMKA